MSKAKEDILIERPDLGPEAYTFVAKDDEIPAVLADLPRHPRNDEKPPKPKG